MIALEKAMREAYESALVGKAVSVLTETVLPDGRCDGYTDTYVPVIVSGAAPGQLIDVRITAYENGMCVGTV